MNIRLGHISRLLSSLSWCHRCKTTWRFVPYHETWYTPSAACFPLCEKCWSELTPHDRFPFYKQLVDEWARGSYGKKAAYYEEKRAQIYSAVLCHGL